MSIFDLFRKKKRKLTTEEQKWNKMWELWEEERISSPCAELMTYESEVNSGGHLGFFDSQSSSSDLEKTMLVLIEVLSGELKENIERAYNAYLKYDGNEEEEETLDELLDECDSVFYDNEGDVEAILRNYAKTIDVDQ